MTNLEKREKLNWFLFMIGYFSAGYLLINWFSQTRATFFDVTTRADLAIPFIPEFIFGYILVYFGVWLTYHVVDEIDRWHVTVWGFMLSTTLAYLCFLIIPVKMTLRPVVDTGSFSGVVTQLYYIIDMPYNCFPSLHVTYPVLATLVVWGRYRRLRYLFLAMAIIVAVSVVLVKQHYIADVFAGVVNATVCYLLAKKITLTAGAKVGSMRGLIGWSKRRLYEKDVSTK